ncbi:hypothetical protein OQA88_10888, partial [Cercophora sp. LCS_1]
MSLWNYKDANTNLRATSTPLSASKGTNSAGNARKAQKLKLGATSRNETSGKAKATNRVAKPSGKQLTPVQRYLMEQFSRKNAESIFAKLGYPESGRARAFGRDEGEVGRVEGGVEEDGVDEKDEEEDEEDEDDDGDEHEEDELKAGGE